MTELEIAEEIIRNHEEFCVGHFTTEEPWCSCAPHDYPLCAPCAKLRDTIAAALLQAGEPLPTPKAVQECEICVACDNVYGQKASVCASHYHRAIVAAELGDDDEWMRAALLKDRTRRAIRERCAGVESNECIAQDFSVPVDFIAHLRQWQLFGDDIDKLAVPASAVSPSSENESTTTKP